MAADPLAERATVAAAISAADNRESSSLATASVAGVASDRYRDWDPAGRRRIRGREGELARIRAALLRLERRESGALVLVGEAGIGKTALLSTATPSH